MSEEKRLIYANALANRIWNEAERYKGTDGFVWVRRGEIGLLLDEAPVVDAVEVVRCCNCEFHDHDGTAGYCNYWRRWSNMSDFCSHGK